MKRLRRAIRVAVERSNSGQIRIAGQELGERSDRTTKQLHVRVEEKHERAVRVPIGLVHGCCEAGILVVLEENDVGSRAERLDRPIDRAVVYDDRLEGDGRSDSSGKRVETASQEVLGVPVDDENGNVGSVVGQAVPPSPSAGA